MLKVCFPTSLSFKEVPKQPTGMVFAINPPTTGNTFDAFRARALQSNITSTTTAAVTAPSSKQRIAKPFSASGKASPSSTQCILHFLSIFSQCYAHVSSGRLSASSSAQQEDSPACCATPRVVPPLYGEKRSRAAPRPDCKGSLTQRLPQKHAPFTLAI